jgi:hypothetical protein
MNVFGLCFWWCNEQEISPFLTTAGLAGSDHTHFSQREHFPTALCRCQVAHISEAYCTAGLLLHLCAHDSSTLDLDPWVLH